MATTQRLTTNSHNMKKKMWLSELNHYQSTVRIGWWTRCFAMWVTCMLASCEGNADLLLQQQGATAGA